MTHEIGKLPEPRELSQAERALTAWLLTHGCAEGEEFLAQLTHAKVIAHCKCGCASIDFAVEGKQPQTFAMRVLSDYQWKDEKGRHFGAMVFEQDNLLAGLELWSIDGQATAYALPSVEILVPYGTPGP
jgi:hypothetical protein